MTDILFYWVDGNYTILSVRIVLTKSKIWKKNNKVNNYLVPEYNVINFKSTLPFIETLKPVPTPDDKQINEQSNLKLKQ